jgi:hypothetical protein
MEMMVELEAKYEREVKVSGYSFERFQKYVQILNKLQRLIISDAVADDYKSKSDTFTKLMNSNKSCIFAGWASEIVTVKATKTKKASSKCAHPAQSTNKAVREAYGATKNTCTSNQISCNPMVFGFQKNATSAPFCVETGFTAEKTNNAHNVSYECMRASLTVEGSAIQDSKAERLDAMTDAISKNTVAFNEVQKYIFRTCACNDADNKMDKIYKEYIRPHRTCFGLMNSLRHFGYKECSDLTNSLNKENKDFVEQWNEYFNDNNIHELTVPLTKEPEEFDKVYRDMMTSPLVTQYCEKGFVPPASDKKEWVCKTTCTYQEPVDPTIEKPIFCTIDEASWKITKDGKEEFTTAELEKMTIDDAKAPKTMVKLKDTSEEDQVCPVVVVEKVEVIKPSCKISFTQEKEQSKATVSFQNLDKNEVTEINWKVGEADPKAGVEKEILLGKDDKKVFVEFSFKDEKGVVGEKQSCPGEVPEKDDGDKKIPTLDVEAEAAQPTLVKLNAKVSLGGKPLTMPSPEGLHLSWISYKDGGKTIVPFVKPPETKLVDTKVKTPEEIKAEEAAAAAAPKAVVTEGEFSQAESVIVSRLEKAYETCASLIDAQGKTVVEKICKPIPALEKSNNNNNNNYNPNQNAPRPTFIVPRYNTRQQGIQ